MEIFYRLVEWIDGEKGIMIIPYRIAERIKLFCLRYIR